MAKMARLYRNQKQRKESKANGLERFRWGLAEELRGAIGTE